LGVVNTKAVDPLGDVAALRLVHRLRNLSGRDTHPACQRVERQIGAKVEALLAEACLNALEEES